MLRTRETSCPANQLIRSFQIRERLLADRRTQQPVSSDWHSEVGGSNEEVTCEGWSHVGGCILSQKNPHEVGQAVDPLRDGFGEQFFGRIGARYIATCQVLHEANGAAGIFRLKFFCPATDKNWQPSKQSLLFRAGHLARGEMV